MALGERIDQAEPSGARHRHDADGLRRLALGVLRQAARDLLAGGKHAAQARRWVNGRGFARWVARYDDGLDADAARGLLLAEAARLARLAPADRGERVRRHRAGVGVC